MPGPKDKKPAISEVAADFFGDDLDWLSDDEEAAPAAAAPIQAPAPEPAAVAADWRSAPTLFAEDREPEASFVRPSQVPTIVDPSEWSEEPAPVASDPPSPVAAREEPAPTPEPSMFRSAPTLLAFEEEEAPIPDAPAAPTPPAAPTAEEPAVEPAPPVDVPTPAEVALVEVIPWVEPELDAEPEPVPTAPPTEPAPPTPGPDDAALPAIEPPPATVALPEAVPAAAGWGPWLAVLDRDGRNPGIAAWRAGAPIPAGADGELARAAAARAWRAHDPALVDFILAFDGEDYRDAAAALLSASDPDRALAIATASFEGRLAAANALAQLGQRSSTERLAALSAAANQLGDSALAADLWHDAARIAAELGLPSTELTVAAARCAPWRRDLSLAAIARSEAQGSPLVDAELAARPGAEALWQGIAGRDATDRFVRLRALNALSGDERAASVAAWLTSSASEAERAFLLWEQLDAGVPGVAAELLKLDPDCAPALAAQLMAHGRTSPADQLQRALADVAHDPSDAAAWRSVTRWATATGDHTALVSGLRELSARAPSDAFAARQTLYAEIYLGDADRVSRAFEALVAAEPEDRRADVEAAHAFFLLGRGRVAEAMGILRRVNGAAASTPGWAAGLHAFEQPEVAAQLLSEAIQASPDPTTRRQLRRARAALLLRLDHGEAALGELEVAAMDGASDPLVSEDLLAVRALVRPSAVAEALLSDDEGVGSPAWRRLARARREAVTRDARALVAEPGLLGEVAALVADDLDLRAGVVDTTQVSEPSRTIRRFHLGWEALARGDLPVVHDMIGALGNVGDGLARGAAVALATRAGAWQVVADLLDVAASDDALATLERARIAAFGLGDQAEAASLADRLTLAAPGPLPGWWGDLVRIAGASGDRALAARVWRRVVAEAADDVAGHHQVLGAARFAESTGNVGEAAEAWAWLARRSGPDSLARACWRSALGSLGAGNQDLLEAWSGAPAACIARVLEASDASAAAAQWRDASEADAVEACIARYILAVRGEAWREAFDALSALVAAPIGASTRAYAESLRRDLLATHLADTDDALGLYERLHQDDPSDRRTVETLARIASRRGDDERALRYLRELSVQPTDDAEAARLLVSIGEIAEKAGDAPGARQAWLDALDYRPSDGAALSGLKRLAEADGDPEALIAVLRREATLATDAGDRLRALRAVAEATEGRLSAERARDAWGVVLDEAPRDEVALRRLYALAEARSNQAEILEFGVPLSEIVPAAERGAIYARVGRGHRARAANEEASAWLERALTADPPDPTAADDLAQLHRDRGDRTALLRVLRVVAARHPDADRRADAWREIAIMERDVRHDRAAAAEAFSERLALVPTDEDALRFLFNWHSEAGRQEAALTVAEALEGCVTQGVDLDDFDHRVELSTFYFRFAELLRGASRSADALHRYEQALDLNPTHLPTLDAIGPLYAELSMWTKAEAVFRQVVQLVGGAGDRQRVAEAYTWLGRAERELGESEKAFKRFNKALDVLPNFVPALKGLARILEDRADWTSLLNVYNNVIFHATSPADVVHAYMTKGRVLDDHLQRPDKAAQHYERSLAFDANQPGACLRLAELAMRRDAWSECAQHARRGLEIGRGHAVEGDLILSLAAAIWFSDGTTQASDLLIELGQVAPELAARLGPTPFAEPARLKALVHERLPR